MMSFLFLFFFFKQKTAYELRISDWSSDVCSSDLLYRGRSAHRGRVVRRARPRSARPRSPPCLDRRRRRRARREPCREHQGGRSRRGRHDHLPGRGRPHQGGGGTGERGGGSEVNSEDRKCDVLGKSVCVRVKQGSRRINKKK